MSKIRLHGSSSGYTEIAPVAASGNNTLTLPNDGTLISKDSNGSVGVTSVTVGTGVTIGDGRVTANSFVIGGSALLSGITEVDHYQMSSDVTSSGTNATITVWQRIATSQNAAAASPHGTGMSVSSGIFTFPSTGKYFILLSMKGQCGVDDNIQIYIKTTTDNSSYTVYSSATDGQNGGSGTRAGSGTACAFIDVTNVSNVKVLFHADSLGSDSKLSGGGTSNTEVIFIRIADT